MRLGLRPTLFEPKTEQSKLRRLYGSKEVAWERHRHRYEVEPKYVEELESKGIMRFIGKDERGERMQMLELDGKSLRYLLNHLADAQTTHTLSDYKPTLNSAPDRSTHHPLSSVSLRQHADYPS